jgi:hypothetical protein
MKKKKTTPRAASQSKSRRKGVSGRRAVQTTAVAYWDALMAAGYLQGPAGNMTFNGDVRKLLDATYEVLAGGTLLGTVPGNLTVTAGAQPKVAEFKRLREARLAAINRAGGPRKLKMKTG